MPITPTPKIWMDGAFADWDEAARVRVLTHTLHYGTGNVFEGIRAYETAQGPAVFRPDPTTSSGSCSTRPEIVGLDIPYTVDELVQATQGTRWPPPACPGRHVRPIAVLTATARWGRSKHAAVLGSARGHRLAGRGAPTSVTTPATKGVRMKISVLDPPRPQHHAAGLEDHRQLRQLARFAKVEALKAGYDEAIMLNLDGYVSECTGENIFVARNGVLVTPPSPPGRSRASPRTR